MDGPPERIEAEVRTRIAQLGRDGGYFCYADQGLPWPKEHIEVLQRAVEEYGTYPIEGRCDGGAMGGGHARAASGFRHRRR